MFQRKALSLLLILPLMLAACVSAQKPATGDEPVSTSIPASAAGAYATGKYPNAFRDLLGKSDAEIQAKLESAWQQLFYGNNDTQRVYYPVGQDMAYIKDIGSGDVRSEGMSYGMMIAVQLDKQEEFNRIWKWARTYMYQADGPYKGYFAWHCQDNGKQIDANPASDGEEWFAMALFFASGRWGDGEGIFNYRAEAQAILDTMLHKEDGGSVSAQPSTVTNMFNKQHKQVVFVPDAGNNTFTDPSYHLPAYYELWAVWADKDQGFWKEAAQSSRVFFKQAAHPKTGLMPDYANFDGTPYGSDGHKDFRFDAFRVGQNLALDTTWFAADPWQVEQLNRMLDFFYSEGIHAYTNQYTLDGKPLSGDSSPGLEAMNGVAAMAATNPHRQEFVQAVWDTRIPSGKWRYYDGLLYHLALLQLSGNFRIYPPEGE